MNQPDEDRAGLTLTDVRPWGGPSVDLAIVDGLIADVTPAGRSTPAGSVIDGGGALALPGLINAHAHLDKTWWGRPWISYEGGSTTHDRIAHERAARDGHGLPDAAQAAALLREMLRHGTTAVRTHVDVDLGVGLRGIEVVQAAVADLDGAVQVEIVAFPQDGVIRRPGMLGLLERAVAAGASAIGGLDPASIDRDPVGQLDAIFGVAERHGVGVDIHLHDRGELGAFQCDLIIERTRRAGLHGRVTISHGFALGDLSGDRRKRLLDDLAEAGVAWTTVAPVGLPPLPWPAMRDRGIALGLGTDGVRDLWSPFGNGDLLRTALDFARLQGRRDDEVLVESVELATSGGAGFVQRERHDLAAGARADLVLIDAQNVPDALVRCPERRLVLSAGRVVARDGTVLV